MCLKKVFNNNKIKHIESIEKAPLSYTKRRSSPREYTKTHRHKVTEVDVDVVR